MKSNDGFLPFWDHVEELRKTLIQILFVIAVGFAFSLYFYQPLMLELLKPLKNLSGFQQDWEETLVFHKQLKNTSKQEQILHLPSRFKMIYPLPAGVIQSDPQTFNLAPYASIEIVETSLLVLLNPIEGFASVIKLSLWLSLVATSPIWLFLLLRFITPAVTVSLRQQLFWFLPLFGILFYAGLISAYYVTIPLANQYLFAFGSGIGMNLWNLASYLEYTLLLLLGNGLGFELSGILFLLIHLQIVELEMLYQMRRYAYVVILILSAVLTPPDILSQLLLTIPLCGLYELGILQARWKNTLKKTHAAAPYVKSL